MRASTFVELEGNAMFNNQQVLEAAGFSKDAARYSMFFDIIVVVAVVLLFGGVIALHCQLLAGDWDFFIDWRDRQFWPLIYPIVAIMFPAALAAVFWENFRLPIGATVGATLLVLSVWLMRWGAWHEFANYPFSMITPAQTVTGGLILDGLLLVFRNYLFVGIFGGFLYGFVFYFVNYAPIMPYYLPVEHMGSVASVADMIGYTFPRSTTPEYIRIVERGTLRTFGDTTVWYTAAFSGFICIFTYLIWWHMGLWFAQTTFFANYTKVKSAMGLKD